MSTNARLFKEIKDEIDFSSGFVENRVVNGERIAKAVRASERLYKEELYNFGYHEVSSDEEDDEGLQSTDFVENKLCFKELCVLTRSKPLFSLPDFTFQFNPLIQFYKDVYFLFLSFVDFRYSLSSVPSFSLDFSYAILSFSFFRCQEYPHFDLRFTDFYLIFRDLVSDCIENPRLVYFYYSVICESMETYKDLVDQNQGFHYFVKMREEKKSMFQIIKELVIEKRGEAFYHEAVLGKPLERQKDATLDFDQRQIC